MQLAILAGGLATRLGALTERIPKSMLRFEGKPFLEHQIELVRGRGVDRLVLCIGHLGEQIQEYFGDGTRFGVRVAYSDEGESRLGTGGALKLASPLLEDSFFVMWGDSYLLLDYQGIWDTFERRDLDALMVVYRNEGRGVPSNVAVAGDMVARYNKWAGDASLRYIDHGLSALRKSVLNRIPEETSFGVETVFRDLAAEGLLGAYETTQRFYEVGSPEGIAEFEALIGESGGE